MAKRLPRDKHYLSDATGKETKFIKHSYKMDFLLGAGVDGIITNKPGLLSQRISLKYNHINASGMVQSFN